MVDALKIPPPDKATKSRALKILGVGATVIAMAVATCQPVLDALSQVQADADGGTIAAYTDDSGVDGGLIAVVDGGLTDGGGVAVVDAGTDAGVTASADAGTVDAGTVVTTTSTVVFSEGWAPGYQDFSFGVFSNGGNSLIVSDAHTGTKAIQVGLNQYGAFNIFATNGIDYTSVGVITFWYKSDTQLDKLYISTGGSATFFVDVSKNAVNTWSKVTVNATDFAAPAIASSLVIQTVKSATLTFDDISYTNQVSSIDTSVPAPPTGVPTVPAPTTRWVDGYFAGYEMSLLPPENIPFGPNGLTHVTVTRVVPNADGSLVENFDYDAINGPLMAKRVSAAAHAAGKKALLMIGGSGTAGNFSAALGNTFRPKLVANLLAAASRYNCDGISADFEPIPSSDEPKVLAFIGDLRKAAGVNFLITIPMAWAPGNEAFAAKVAPWVNVIELMTYDSAGAWPGWVSWHSSALQGDGPSTPSSVNKSVTAYLAAGVPANKLSVGVGGFGMCYQGPTAPLQANVGQVIADDGVMSYTNIVSLYLPVAGVTRVFDTNAQVPYLTSATPFGPKKCTYVTYEDEQSVTAKVGYIRSRGLAGILLWTVGQTMVNGTSPIITAASAAQN